MHYLGSQILGGFKGLEKRQFIVITDKYMVLAKYPRLPGIYLYSIIGGINRIIKPGRIRYSPEEMEKVMRSIDKHKIQLIPLDQIASIDITMPKKGLFSSKKGYFTIKQSNGQIIQVYGEHDCLFEEIADLLNQLFPGKVNILSQ